MNTWMHRMSRRGQHGFSLLEVLIAIVIFAIGLVALAQLQGNLTRYGGLTKNRALAVNLAEDQLEEFRAFSQSATDPLGVNESYEDIVDNTAGVAVPNQGGTNFNVAWDVTDYYYLPATQTYTSTRPGTWTGVSSYKMVTVTVDWVDPTFDESSPDADTTQIVLKDVIPSNPPSVSGRVVSGPSGPLGPRVPYTPGLNPDVVAISLNAAGNRFKESLVPEPEVFRKQGDEFVLTAFDVITFTTDGSTRFLRREEFVVLNCECVLGSIGVGRRPTVWNGVEYVEGKTAAKRVGSPNNNRNQDPLCELCCRDHHDGGTAVESFTDTTNVAEDDPSDTARILYDPWSGAAHSHYKRNNSGDLVTAAVGDEYLENCRLIRKDGFFRVTQDAKLAQIHAMPEDYLDSDAEVDEYSAYVTNFVKEYIADIDGTYPGSQPSPANFNANGTTAPPTSTTLPLLSSTEGDDGVLDQQLRARNIYIDYLTREVRTLYSCIAGGTAPADCGAENVTDELEIVPFFDLNVTLLAEWFEDPNDDPVIVTNERLESENTHSRGLIARTSFGGSDVTAQMADSNTGLTNTQGVSPADEIISDSDTLGVDASGDGDGDPPEPSGDNVQGDISTEGGTGADPVGTVDVTGGDSTVVCSKTGASYLCEFSTTTGDIVVSSYNTSNKNNEVCDVAGTLTGVETGTGVNEVTTFSLSGVSGTVTLDLIIRKNGC